MFHELAVAKMGFSFLLLHIGLIVFGLLNCFYGYRVFRFLLGVWGFIGGVTLGVWLMRGIEVGPLGQLLGALIAGILGVFIVTFLYILGVFLFGAGFGLLVASLLFQSWPAVPQWPVAIILCVLGGVAAVALQSPLIKLLTAFSGAWIVIASAAFLLTGQSLNGLPPRSVVSSFWIMVIYGAWLLLGALGLSAQMQIARRRRTVEEQEC
jgi:hypothetical protein